MCQTWKLRFQSVEQVPRATQLEVPGQAVCVTPLLQQTNRDIMKPGAAAERGLRVTAGDGSTGHGQALSSWWRGCLPAICSFGSCF